MVLSPQFLKKKFGNTKKTHTFAHVEVTTVINTLKTITIMQKFIISVKDKNTGRDVIPPYIVNSLDGLGSYSERVSPMGLIVIVDSIKETNDFIEVEPNIQCYHEK
jgi:hypothetical protein